MRLLRAHRELCLFAGAYLVYVAARWAFASDLGTARANAGWVLDLEARTGTQVEGSVQRAFDSGLWTSFFANVYLAAQLLVLPVALIGLHRFAPPVYRMLRSTVIATWAISIPIFAIFPVAPPRLAGIGLADTVSGNAAASLRGSSTLFYNPYAAVPSLHVGFAFAVGVAVVMAARRPGVKLVAGLWGPLVTLSVVATGNHYLFDVVAGLAVTGLGWWVGRTIEHRVARRTRTRSTVARWPSLARRRYRHGTGATA